jgi:serine/threonine-protein kinase
MVITEGTKIDGRYIIQKLIGEGGMANVYLAKDIILNRFVAVKVLHEQLAKQDRFIERFRREAEAVSSIIHPNVVEIYDVGQYENCYFIVMELLEGQTLKEYIKEKQFLSVSETISIMKQVCDGVDVAHKQGIVHRDLKPQNIFIRKDGVIKIMDFGIAYQQDASPLTQTNAVMGSVHYLAPEQAKGENASIQTDIYSLGIVMYEMLTGSVPYTGDSAVNIVLRHLRETVPYVSEKNEHVPQSVENIIIRATAKNPADRYHSMAEMRHDLDTALNVERMNEPRVYFDVYEDEATQKEIELLENTGEMDEDAYRTTTEYIPPERKLNQRKIMIIVGAVLTVLILAGTSLYLSLSGKNLVAMPDIENKTIAEANQILVDHKLKLGEQKEVYSETIEVGRIVATSVPKNSEVAVDTVVNVDVSKGKAFKLGNYVGRDIDSVRTELKNLDIMVSVEEQEPDHSGQKDGLIVAQNPKADQPFNIENDTLKLTVIRRKEFQLSNLAGFDEAAARGYATENGLEIVVVYEFSESVASGKVIQIKDYYPNKLVKRGDTITIMVSKGSEGPKVPPKPTPPPTNGNEDNNNNSNNNDVNNGTNVRRHNDRS